MIASKRPPVLAPAEPRPRSETCTVIPMRRPAFLLDGDDLVAIEVHALIYDLTEETTRYVATFNGSVATASEFNGGDVVWTEGDAIRIRVLRQNADRKAAIINEQRRQCDDAIRALGDA
jgi:hypothetical protein